LVEFNGGFCIAHFFGKAASFAPRKLEVKGIGFLVTIGTAVHDVQIMVQGCFSQVRALLLRFAIRHPFEHPGEAELSLVADFGGNARA
jgi:hypothetical protein